MRALGWRTSMSPISGARCVQTTVRRHRHRHRLRLRRIGRRRRRIGRRWRGLLRRLRAGPLDHLGAGRRHARRHGPLAEETGRGCSRSHLHLCAATQLLPNRLEAPSLVLLEASCAATDEGTAPENTRAPPRLPPRLLPLLPSLPPLHRIHEDKRGPDPTVIGILFFGFFSENNGVFVRGGAYPYLGPSYIPGGGEENSPFFLFSVSSKVLFRSVPH